LITGGETLIDRRSRLLQHMRKMLWAARMPTYVKQRIEAALPEMLQDITVIERFAAVMSPAQQQAFIEQFSGAGVLRMSNNGDKDRIVLWNPNRHPGLPLCPGYDHRLVGSGRSVGARYRPAVAGDCACRTLRHARRL
jgi:hypothetical protein